MTEAKKCHLCGVDADKLYDTGDGILLCRKCDELADAEIAAENIAREARSTFKSEVRSE